MNDHEPLLDRLRSMWTAVDPCPVDLAERVIFRWELEDVDLELMSVQAELAGSGTRGPAPPGPEVTTTVIFESSRLSLTISVTGAPGAGSPDAGPRRRVDGWISPSAAMRVRLHGADRVLEQTADDDGRFAFDDVPAGLVRFTVEPTPDAALHLDRAVVTPHVAV